MASRVCRETEAVSFLGTNQGWGAHIEFTKLTNDIKTEKKDAGSQGPHFLIEHVVSPFPVMSTLTTSSTRLLRQATILCVGRWYEHFLLSQKTA